MTLPKKEFTLDAIVTAVIDAFPKLSMSEQRVSIALYRLLAQGHPADAKGLSDASGVAVNDVREMIAGWHGVERGPNGAVTGFWGLTLSETKHRFRINGSELHTWCAWDTLFLPPILHASSDVDSRCPITGNPIVLRIGPGGVETVQPETVVVSFLLPREADIEKSVIESFCCYVHFLVSPEAGEKWVSQRPGTFLLSLSDAWEIGIRKNATQFADIG